MINVVIAGPIALKNYITENILQLLIDILNVHWIVDKCGMNHLLKTIELFHPWMNTILAISKNVLMLKKPAKKIQVAHHY